jgi:thiamine-phosphate pyrophosphorylase
LRGRIPRKRGQLVTGAAHGRRGLARAKALGLDAALLSPVFATRSRAAGAPLGALRAGRLARGGGLPVYALGGINARTGPRLIGRGFAGIASVDGLLD